MKDMKCIGAIHIAVNSAQRHSDAEAAAGHLARREFDGGVRLFPYDDRPPTAEEKAHPDYKSMHECMCRGLPTWGFSFVVCRY